MIKNNLGLQTLLDRIKNANYSEFRYHMKVCGEDFYVDTVENKKFVFPILSIVNDYSTCNLSDAKIILVEAVGASGKTELTKKMSRYLSCPIFDLGKTDVVAGNSLTGLLAKRLQRQDCFELMDNITAGKSTILIDALDEGYLRTNTQGFFDFLDDVISLEPNKSCPIVLLGRYNAVELAASFLFDKKFPFVTLQIEPFTLAQAEEFIDKSVSTSARDRYSYVYKELRNYILSTIDGFFKDQHSIVDQAAERFIGYAPVLQSIAAFFDERTNYKVVLDEMKTENVRSVNLIVNIIERILKRDRNEKVLPVIEGQLLEGRDIRFCDQVLEHIYDIDEQCARLLYKVENISFPDLEIGDRSFLLAYNDRITTWITEHPFLGKNRIANIVFESYILARLTKNPKYRDVAYAFIKEKGISYMFAYIYYAIHGFNDIDSNILPYIYESLRELNNKQSHYEFSLDCINSVNNGYNCEFSFNGSNENLTNYEGSVFFLEDARLDLGSRLEYLNINIPIEFCLSRRNVEVVAPSYIKCGKLSVGVEELTVTSNEQNASFMFECDELVVDTLYAQYLQIVGPGKGHDVLRLVCPSQPEYPLFDCWKSADESFCDLSKDILVKYKKLRAIILEFRSHSKRELAKHHERIDFVLGANDMGKDVIQALIDNKIMFKRDHLYILDTEVMDQKLGLSYDGIRNFEMNDTIKSFLNGIK